MKYFNLKTVYGVETVDEIDRKDFNNDKENEYRNICKFLEHKEIGKKQF